MSQVNSEKIDIVDSLSNEIIKLKFLSESIACWNDDIGDFDEELRIGFSCIMQETINKITLDRKKLEEIKC